MHRLFALTAIVSVLTISVKADSFVVLPFFNVSKDANLDWIGESLAESVRESLAGEGYVALDRAERVEAYHRLAIRPYVLLTKASIIRIADTLDAEHVIYGQFDLKPGTAGPPRSKGSLQIGAHILDLKRIH